MVTNAELSGLKTLDKRLLLEYANWRAQLMYALRDWEQNPDEVVQERGIEYYEEMERKDTQYASCLQTRKNALLSQGWQITPASDEKSDMEVANFVETSFKSVEGTFEQNLRELMDAYGKGYSILEKIWWIPEIGPLSGKATLKALHHKPPQYFRFLRDEYGNLKPDGLEIVKEGSLTGTPLPISKFIIYSFNSKYGNPWGLGLGSVCSWYYWFKKNGLKWWALFLEKFGMPTVLIKEQGTVQAPAEADIAEAKKVAEAIQTDTAAYIPPQFVFDLLEASGDSTGKAAYNKMIEYCDNQEAKAILGGTLTQDAGKVGSYALGRIHAEVKDDIIIADALELAEVIDEQLVKELVDYNFRVTAYPKFSFKIRKSIDVQKVASAVSLLVKSGAKIPVNWVNDTFNIPQAEEGEEVLEAQASGAPGGFTEHVERRKTKKSMKRRRDPWVRQFTERAGKWTDKVAGEGAKRGSQEVEKILAGIVDQVRKKKILEEKNYEAVDRIAVNVGGLKTVLYETMLTAHLQGRLDALSLLYQKGVKLAEYQYFSYLIFQEFPDEPMTYEQAKKYFMGKVPITRKEFDQLSDLLKTKAFTVAGIEKNNILKLAQTEIFKAIEQGMTLSDFAFALEQAGVRYTGGLQLSGAHLETVFRTNLMSSYNTGRWEQYNDPDVKDMIVGYQYNAILDGRERPQHGAMDGLIFAANDPVWKTWWPPNGFNCRCVVDPVTKYDEIQAYDKAPTTTKDDAGNTVPVKVDPGFTGSVVASTPPGSVG
jgi:SPP1 gp7 family putative phage head morphogenesis protein